MDSEIPILAGFMDVAIQPAFTRSLCTKKKSLQRYCLLFKSSCHGIGRLELRYSTEDKNPTTITFENCVQIIQEPAPAKLIQVVKRTGIVTLSTSKQRDLTEWLNALQKVAFRDAERTDMLNTKIEEQNGLYCKSFDDDLFIVTLSPSKTSVKCSLMAKTYVLHLTSTELQLKLIEDLSIIVEKWQYRFIRKYGYRGGKFTFEAGRKCSTGEGIFTLEHSNPLQVFRCMSSKMKSMKKIVKENEEEHQLNAVPLIEASRSPLLQSMLSKKCTDIAINLNHSSLSVKDFTSSKDSTHHFSIDRNSSAIEKASNLSPSTSSYKSPNTVVNCIEKKPSASVTMIRGLTDSLSSYNNLRALQNCEMVSITTSLEPFQVVGSPILLKPSPAEIMTSLQCNLNGNRITVSKMGLQYGTSSTPVSSENTKIDREYEYIGSITDAWKTLGLDEVKHWERKLAKEDVFVWHRTKSHRSKQIFESKRKNSKMENFGFVKSNIDAKYDRLNFLYPNNILFNGYKTIVNIRSNTTDVQNCSIVNDYELVTSCNEKQSHSDSNHLHFRVVK